MLINIVRHKLPPDLPPILAGEIYILKPILRVHYEPNFRLITQKYEK